MIVDANSAYHLKTGTDDGLPVRRWLLEGKQAGLIVGGKLTRELDTAGLRDTLVALDRAGRLRRVPDAVLAKRVAALDGQCESNDVHVVALALESQCDLVFTADKPLHTDLRTHSVTGRKIKIYQNRKHHRLLKPCVCMTD